LDAVHKPPLEDCSASRHRIGQALLANRVRIEGQTPFTPSSGENA